MNAARGSSFNDAIAHECDQAASDGRRCDAGGNKGDFRSAALGDGAPSSSRDVDRPRRLVVKIGSSTLTTSDSSIDFDYLDVLADQISVLKDEGWQVVIVSSGAIACGLGCLGIEKRPTAMPALQAAASVGQSELVAAYARSFGCYDIITSLVLLTRRDTADRTSYLHARDTLNELLGMGVVPIVNENDTVSIEQIRFGDNDSLAALVACLIDADLMVIASDVDGLYDANPSVSPDAKLVRRIDRITKDVMDVAGGAGSVVGSGGMLSKVQAARVLMVAGIPMAVVDGKCEGAIVDTAHGACPGTLFASKEAPHAITPRKLWIALGDNARGAVHVDDGARCALEKHGSSLLSVGVSSVEGSFDEGDIVDVRGADGVVIARGRALASSDEVKLALGLTRDEIASNRILARLAETPVVHRDELILFE